MPDILISNGYLILFQKVSVQMELSLSRGFIKLHITVLALGAVADFGAQNCQYTTKVDAR